MKNTAMAEGTPDPNPTQPRIAHLSLARDSRIAYWGPAVRKLGIDAE